METLIQVCCGTAFLVLLVIVQLVRAPSKMKWIVAFTIMLIISVYAVAIYFFGVWGAVGITAMLVLIVGVIWHQNKRAVGL